MTRSTQQHLLTICQIFEYAEKTSQLYFESCYKLTNADQTSKRAMTEGPQWSYKIAYLKTS